ncbi:MAG: efflux RND transporter permease subunit, partial [Clostridia bacterium]|nr:efflux RND transporter permease subunit [Clostridia bacterium]
AQNFAMPAGYVEQDGVAYMVSVGEEITDFETVQGLVLFDMGMEGVEPVYLTDVAVVMLTDNSDLVYSKLNGENSITLQFEKQSTYSTAGATDNINKRFEELEEAYPGLSFVALMNQGDYIYLIVNSISSSLLLGALFAIIVLFIFLRDIRPTFITLCSIPISVIFAITLMYFCGVTINMISLSGLAVAVGMLVDNSVVVIENIYRLRTLGVNPVQAAVSGAKQVAGAVTSSTLTTVCVFLPIVFVKGITRQLFTDLALTMTFALVASLIVSLTLVPAMAGGMLKKQRIRKDAAMTRFLSGYGKAVAWALKHKAIVLSATVVLLLATGGLSLLRGFQFMPEMDMPTVNITITMPEDADMETAVGLADEVLARIDTLDGIATVGANMSSGDALSSLGGGGSSFDVSAYVTLENEKDKGSEVGKKIVELCSDLPCEISYSSEMLDTSMLLGGDGISMRIYSENLETLQNAAKTAAEVLRGVDGVAEVSDGLEDVSPALHIYVDRNEAMKKGLTVAQVYMDIASSLTMETAGADIELDGTTTAVVIEKPEEVKLTVDQLEDHIVKTTGQDGSVIEVPLGEIAEIRETTGLSSISRLSQRRYISVSATIDEDSNVTIATSAAERAMKNADLGDGVTYVFTGENETIMDSVRQLVLMILLGVLLVYLVMVAQFQSLKAPFIVMFTIPLAFTGGFISILVCGMEISVVSLIGFVMLVGIIVNNGIVLVEYINQLRQDGKERREAIIEAGQTRMRPILMTTITTIMGLIQMALSNNAGTALMRPIAIVCIGGLTYATLMTLFVVPCIYDILNRKELRKVEEKDLEILDI